jgi:hypothetical protein
MNETTTAHEPLPSRKRFAFGTASWMMDVVPRLPIDRRAFCAALAAALVGGCSKAPTPTADPHADLIGLLGLQPVERAWLDSLSAAEQRTLRDELMSAPGTPSRRSVDLLMKVLGRRERLFAYVDYPPRANGLTACDGLIRE